MMNIIIPPKIQSRNKISVVAPAGFLKNVSSKKGLAWERFTKEFDLDVTFPKHTAVLDLLGSSPLESRIRELHGAFRDKTIKAILCSTGGYNSNDLLPYIDWKIIKNNPKPIVGSSDITVLLNAIYAKTGMMTYFGPNFFKFGMKLDLEYTLDYFKKCLMSDAPYSIIPSKRWSNDRWYKNQDERIFYKNEGWLVCNSGVAKGEIVGGNLCSLNLLQGTEFMPNLKGAILFIEDDDLAGADTFGEFNRNLQSLLQLPTARYIKGIVVGRFQPKTEMTPEKLKFIFKTKKQLKGMPIVVNVDFGHNDPMFTFPVGGTVEVIMQGKRKEIRIIHH